MPDNEVGRGGRFRHFRESIQEASFEYRLLDNAPEMYALLKEFEHSQDSEFCAWCEMAPVHHHPDCRLAAVLKAVEGE